MADYISKIQLPGGTGYNLKASALPYGVTSGDGSAYTVTVSPEVSLVDGTAIIVKFNVTNNSTTPTLNVNSLGAKPIIEHGGTNVNGILIDFVHILIYDSTYDSNSGCWILNPSIRVRYRTSTSSNNEYYPILVSHSDSPANNTAQYVDYSRAIKVNSTNNNITEGANTSCASYVYNAHAEGYYSQANGNNSHAEGIRTKANSEAGHAEGNSTKTVGVASHAEGYNSETGGSYTSNTKTAGTQTGAGAYAHAEGNATIAQGIASHSEGRKTFSKGNYSHAEGSETTASGAYSHAEGHYTVASGANSHTEGCGTQTQNGVEHTEGSYNLSHTDNAADGFGTNGSRTIHSIGIGTADNARMNAVEVMQNGDVYIKGVGSYDGIHIKGESGAPSGLQTLQEYIAALEARIAALENNV